MKILFLLLFTLFFYTDTLCQGIPIGTWRTHLSYRVGKSVAIVGNKVYCATESGFFYFDKDDNSLRPLSKIDGFSDINISKINYNTKLDILLIGYENGNIDLLKGNEIINVNDIERSNNIVGEKTINHIYFAEFKDRNGIDSLDMAYLSCAFGIVVLDLSYYNPDIKNGKLEVKETYSELGNNGAQIEVFGTTMNNDSLFLATANGVMAARLAPDINLLDFNNWLSFSDSTVYNFTVNGNILDSIAFMYDTSWNYTFDTATYIVDSLPKSQIQLILFNDSVSPFVPTDTLIVWPTYYNNYQFDTLGNATDSSIVFPDSVMSIETNTVIIPASNINISGKKAYAIASFNNKVYTGLLNENVIHFYNGKYWQKTNIPLSGGISDMKISADKLLITESNSIIILNKNDSLTILTNKLFNYPSEAAFDSEGFVWIADGVNGLVSDKDNPYKSYYPNGPFSSDVVKLYYSDGGIYTLPGGFGKWGGVGFSLFKDEQWEHIYPATPVMNSLITMVKNPVDNKIYFGSMGYGLFEQQAGWPSDLLVVHNDLNSTIKNSCQAGSPSVMVTGLAVDKGGNLWISNWQSDCANECGGGPYIHVKKIDETWESFDFGFCFPKDIVIDDNNYKWIRLDQSNEYGILVIPENYKNDPAIHLTDITGNGGLPDINVQCITKDKNGDIWVGTNKGVAVFYNPSSVFTDFTDGDLNASTPIFGQRPLLETEQITTIAVDGGNRKWIGSRNGLWLFDDGATEEIINFTADNSPLLSNNIIDIVIHAKTGEVFIGTDKGIISFRGTSTESKSVHNNVEVFPNPVEPDFYGWVGIKGLAIDAIVKITDVSGNLVYETQAEGGMAVWNVNDYNGNRVKAGVYMIFSTTKDKEDSYVAKIAVKE
ncbi:MAG: hypothetical protein FVQ77_13000 [Cytophagales bacterium]|nr:hypothetical protein [Cytophagales bacterium]